MGRTWPSTTTSSRPTPWSGARSKLEYTSLATTLVEEPFTIANLRRVYEAVWGVVLHAANLRRKVLSTPGLVVPTGEERSTGRAWAELYRRGAPTPLHPPILRPAAATAELGSPGAQHPAGLGSGGLLEG